MRHNILATKSHNYDELIKEAAEKIGLNIASFVRMSAVEKAKLVLKSDSSMEMVQKS